MLLSPYFWLAAIVAAGSLFGLGWTKGAAHAKAEIAAAAEKRKDVITEATDKTVVEYVTKIERIPGPPVIKWRIRERVCPGDRAGVPSTGGATPAASPDAGDRLAADLRSCKANTEQLAALIAAVKANNDGSE